MEQPKVLINGIKYNVATTNWSKGKIHHFSYYLDSTEKETEVLFRDPVSSVYHDLDKNYYDVEFIQGGNKVENPS